VRFWATYEQYIYSSMIWTRFCKFAKVKLLSPCLAFTVAFMSMAVVAPCFSSLEMAIFEIIICSFPVVLVLLGRNRWPNVETAGWILVALKFFSAFLIKL
jgi:hypothetical protein